MSARLRRLMSDYEKLTQEFTGHKYIKVEPMGGNPPERYLITYNNIKGLKWDNAKKCPVETNFHQAEIYLHKNYPREKPQCTLRTEIFHPNFRSKGPICISDHWAAGESLVDVVIQIGQMIQYQNFNPKSPLDAVAARWSRENAHLFPIDNVDLYEPEPEIDIESEDDIEIELMARPDCGLEDIDIELF